MIPRSIIITPLAVIAITVSLASAQSTGQPSRAWSSLAVADIDAIYQSIRDLHPGYRDPETPDFSARVERAYRVARNQAARAQTFHDWRQTTQGFVLSFRDGHTLYRLNAIPGRVRWPGFLIDGRDGGYVVRTLAGVRSADTLAPNGARLLSCDGVPITTLLEQSLDGVEADWTKPPEQIRQAFRLFIDFEMEGAPRVQNCRIAGLEGERTLALSWRTELWTDLAPALAPFTREIDRPINDRTSPDGGRWIGLSSFGDEAALQQLASQIEADTQSLREAPYVVFDLRGNRGGASTWGDLFAGILWGREALDRRIASRQIDKVQRSGKFWRASAPAAREVRRTAEKYAALGPSYESVAAYWSEIGDLIDKAPDKDRSLIEDPCCTPAAASTQPSEPMAPDYKRPVYVLIDAGCFSSCILALEPFRAMGAIMVGEMTGQNEEYGETAGPISTPSGLGRYYVPMSIIRQQADMLFVKPERRWTGAMDDDAGLASWVAAMAKDDLQH